MNFISWRIVILAIVIGILAVGGLVWFFVFSPASPTNQGEPAPDFFSPGGAATNSAVYINPDLHVIVQYPVSWKTDPLQKLPNGYPVRISGVDGYVAVDAGSAKSLDDLVSKMALTKIEGVEVLIEKIIVDGQEGRLVIPKSNEVQNSAIVVAYPKPVEFMGSTFEFLLIYSDTAHIRDWLNRVAFFENTTGELSGSPNIFVYLPNKNDQLTDDLRSTSSVLVNKENQLSEKIEVVGAARVFEGNVGLRFSDPKTKKILKQDFVMANAPDVGAYGMFKYEVSVSAISSPSGEVLLEVFQVSAKDGFDSLTINGSDTDVVSIPLTITY